MSEIERYFLHTPTVAPGECSMRKHPDGAFVSYKDHLSALATRDQRIRELEEQLASARRDAIEELKRSQLCLESEDINAMSQEDAKVNLRYALGIIEMLDSEVEQLRAKLEAENG